MSRRSSREAYFISLVGLFIAAVVACGGSGPATSDASTFCGASRASAAKCAASATSCDSTLTSQCAKLDSVLNTSILDASRDCLESGICGASACLSRSLARTKPLTAHATLEKDYCAVCAPGNASCPTQFYARKGNAPGSLVLPYSEGVAVAVDKACTTDANCAGTFATCATNTIATTVAAALSADVASCVTASFQQDTSATPTTPAGGPTVLQCTPRNCQGCCLDDKCETGDAETGCGTGSVSCQTCSGAQTCNAGACREPCSSANCPGCCDATGACIDGTTNDACGTGGGSCASCSNNGSTFVCSAQQCIDTSCAATCLTGCCDTNGCRPGTAATGCGNNGDACIPCGSGSACDPTARTCYLDPDSTWDFYAISANVPATKTSGASWDAFGGLPDHYVIMYSAGTQAQTTSLNNTLAPIWNQVTLMNIKASQYMSSLSFNIWDADFSFGLLPDDFMGGCTMAVQTSNFDSRLYYWTCAATATQGALKLTGRFLKH